jgi:hypothetical protein
MSNARKTLRDERGIVLIAALGMMVALAGLSLAVANSGQMASLTSALAGHATDAFHVADGSAYQGLADNDNFVPFMTLRTTNLAGESAALPGTVDASYLTYRALPGNLLIRTTDGNLRPAQFGQGEGLGKMYHFRLDARKNVTTAGVDPWGRVAIEAAKPGPCADCGAG